MLFVCFVLGFFVENGSVVEDGMFGVNVLWMYFKGLFFKDFFILIFDVFDVDEEVSIVFE